MTERTCNCLRSLRYAFAHNGMLPKRDERSMRACPDHGDMSAAPMLDDETKGALMAAQTWRAERAGLFATARKVERKAVR